MDDKKHSTSGAPEATAPAARAHNAGGGGAVAGGAKRFSAKRKLTVVQRLLRGESLPRHAHAPEGQRPRREPKDCPGNPRQSPTFHRLYRREAIHRNNSNQAGATVPLRSPGRLKACLNRLLLWHFQKSLQMNSIT